GARIVGDQRFVGRQRLPQFNLALRWHCTPTLCRFAENRHWDSLKKNTDFPRGKVCGHAGLGWGTFPFGAKRLDGPVATDRAASAECRPLHPAADPLWRGRPREGALWSSAISGL